MMTAYTNYWSKHREPSYAERLAAAAAVEQPAAPTNCPYLTKKGAHCLGVPTESGACVGHQKALDAGKELELA